MGVFLMARSVLLSLAAVPLLAGLGCSNEPITKSWVFTSKAPSVSTPLVTDKYIYFGNDVGIDAINRRGGFVWRLDRQGMTVVGGPAQYEDIVLFGATNSTFYAARTDGQELWKYRVEARIKSDPTVYKDTVIFSSYDGHVYALDVTSGKLRWAFPSDQDEGLPGPPTQPAVAAYSAALAAHRKAEIACAAQKEAAEDGAEVTCEVGAAPAMPVSGKGPDWEWPPSDFAYSSPRVFDGTVILGNMDWNVYALDADTGKLRWRTRLNGTVTSTAVHHKGRVYIGSNGRLGGKKAEDGRLYALNLKDGSIPTRKDGTPMFFQAVNEVNSSAAVAGDDLYVGDVAGNLYALDVNTLQQKWSFKTGGPIRGRPVVYKSLVFAGSGVGDRHMYAVNRASGKVFWKYRTGGKVESDPVVVGDELLFTSHDRRLYAFKIRKTP
jgi:eukaryotic-like serine/threonine-protein kinase